MNLHAATGHAFIRTLLVVVALCTGPVLAQAPVPPPLAPPSLEQPAEVIAAPPQAAAPSSLIWAPPSPVGPRAPPDVDDPPGTAIPSRFRIGDPVTVHARKSSWSKAHATPNPQASETELLMAIPAEVAAVHADGSVQIQGPLTIAVNGRDQTLQVAGRVSPGDIDAGNIVDSRRITRASLTWAGGGGMDEPQQRRLIGNMVKLLQLQQEH